MPGYITFILYLCVCQYVSDQFAPKRPVCAYGWLIFELTHDFFPQMYIFKCMWQCFTAELSLNSIDLTILCWSLFLRLVCFLVSFPVLCTWERKFGVSECEHKASWLCMCVRLSTCLCVNTCEMSLFMRLHVCVFVCIYMTYPFHTLSLLMRLTIYNIYISVQL